MNEQKTYSSFQNFRFQGIIFNNSENVTISGIAEINERSVFLNLFTDYKILDKILRSEHRFGGKEIALFLGNKFIKISNEPIILTIKELIKDDIWISDLVFIIYESEIIENQNNIQTEIKNCYNLEDVFPLPGFWPLKENDFPFEVYNDLNEINKSYQFYLDLLEIGFLDVDARQISKLENSTIFKLGRNLFETLKTKKKENPVDILRENLELIVKSYPKNEIEPVKDIYKFPGTAFFPGGDGLYKETAAEKIDFPFNKIMVLGQDFSNVKYLQNAKKQEAENEINSPTWRNLISLLHKVGIKPEDCFYTNVIMGARVAESNSGISAAFKEDNEKFLKECFDFFKKQIEFQKPKLIIVLGIAVVKFLSNFIPELAYYKKIEKIKKIDTDGMAIMPNINFFQDLNLQLNLVILQHPSFSELNIKHRTFKNFPPGETACIELLKEAVKISFHDKF